MKKTNTANKVKGGNGDPRYNGLDIKPYDEPKSMGAPLNFTGSSFASGGSKKTTKTKTKTTTKKTVSKK